AAALEADHDEVAGGVVDLAGDDVRVRGGEVGDRLDEGHGVGALGRRPGGPAAGGGPLAQLGAGVGRAGGGDAAGVVAEERGAAGRVDLEIGRQGVAPQLGLADLDDVAGLADGELQLPAREVEDVAGDGGRGGGGQGRGGRRGASGGALGGAAGEREGGDE